MMEPREGDALIVVDVQNDFAHPDGALYVPGAEKIFPVVRKWINTFVHERRPIFITKDWHPPDHISFDEWPNHCVQNTWGAEIPEVIPSWRATKFIRKGKEQDKDEYSGFAPKDGLGTMLKDSEIKRIFVVGLATDYCVKATVLDALNLGFEVMVVQDGISAVNVNEGDDAKAIDEMCSAGAVMI